MRGAWICMVLILFVRPAWALDADVSRQNPTEIVRQLAVALGDGSVDRLAPWFTARGLLAVTALAKTEREDGVLKRLGAVRSSDLASRDETATATIVDVELTHEGGTSSWILTLLDAAGRIDDVAVEPTPDAPVPKKKTMRFHHNRMAPRPPTPAETNTSAGAPPADSTAPSIPLGEDVQSSDDRTVDFLFATTRTMAEAGGRATYTADRGTAIRYGTVRVHVPDQSEHQPGRIELPRRLSLFGVTLYEAKLDEKKHFVIRYAKPLSDSAFFDTLASRSDHEALVFVHGFNNSFERSVYRFAQILFDLQYKKPAVLFSWASKGDVADYGYDKESALIARDSFRTLLRSLRARGIKKINVIAHSMGNLVAIDALANAAQSADPERVSQLIMAAPDVDRDYFRQMEPKLATIADGLTLYACATDRALMLSKQVAGGVPRAGDVPADGPITMPGLDTIDVSALGQDWFGLNHDVFASNRSVLQDIVALLAGGQHPPRLDMVHGMPLGTTPPVFWRFQP